MHSTGIILKNGDDTKTCTQNCTPVDSINNTTQFHTSSNTDLIKSWGSKQHIPAFEHLSI